MDSVKGDLFLIWLYVFDRGWRSPEEMEVLSGMTEGLKNFAKRYNYAIDDPELIRRYRMIEDGKRDIATRIGVAVRKAEQKTARRVERETAQRVERETAQRVERETAQRVERETAQRVERETAQRVERETTQRVGLENALRMKKDGMDASLISKYTGVSVEQIEKL